MWSSSWHHLSCSDDKEVFESLGKYYPPKPLLGLSICLRRRFYWYSGGGCSWFRTELKAFSLIGLSGVLHTGCIVSNPLVLSLVDEIEQFTKVVVSIRDLLLQNIHILMLSASFKWLSCRHWEEEDRYVGTTYIRNPNLRSRIFVLEFNLH